ncbi:DUF1918 domain-containing protein [Candidatus Frankia alpina]|uniref:DUF1918 domain-containing protein n=1 Tax=Candidatus Frankia alpina TaxID=2699483 RepID=UPI0013D5F86C|nr:DUF1918 domain-containing protein [Candidatus Frankia alpina]
MSASVGDRFVIHGRTVGNPQRHGVVIEIGGADGGPPFVVRWGDGARRREGEGPLFPSYASRRAPRHPAAGPNLTVAVAVAVAIRRPTADDAAAAAAHCHHRATHGGGTEPLPSPPVHTATYRPNEGCLEGIASMRRRDLRRRLRNVPPRFHSEAPKRSTSELLPSNVIYAIHRGMQPSDRPVTLR